MRVDEAVAMLPTGRPVHAFVAGGGRLEERRLGREEAVELVLGAEAVEVSEGGGRWLGHGLLVRTEGREFWLETVR